MEENNKFDEELIVRAIDFAVKEKHIALSMLQKHLECSYRCSATVMDILSELKIIGSGNGYQMRKTLISQDEWVKMKSEVYEDMKIQIIKNYELLDNKGKKDLFSYSNSLVDNSKNKK